MLAQGQRQEPATDRDRPAAAGLSQKGLGRSAVLCRPCPARSPVGWAEFVHDGVQNVITGPRMAKVSTAETGARAAGRGALSGPGGHGISVRDGEVTLDLAVRRAS